MKRSIYDPNQLAELQSRAAAVPLKRIQADRDLAPPGLVMLFDRLACPSNLLAPSSQ